MSPTPFQSINYGLCTSLPVAAGTLSPGVLVNLEVGSQCSLLAEGPTAVITPESYKTI
jgi:hypothetical protein